MRIGICSTLCWYTLSLSLIETGIMKMDLSTAGIHGVRTVDAWSTAADWWNINMTTFIIILCITLMSGAFGLGVISHFQNYPEKKQGITTIRTKRDDYHKVKQKHLQI